MKMSIPHKPGAQSPLLGQSRFPGESERPYKPRLMQKISFRLDGDRFRYLERYSAAQGVPMSWVVRHLLNRFVDEQRRTYAPIDV